MGNTKKRFEKINEVFAKPVVVALVTVFAAVAGALAGAAYQNSVTENEIVRVITTELGIIDENKGLAATIDTIKTDLEDAKEREQEALSKVDELNAVIRESGNIQKKLDEEKEAKQALEDQLAEYNYVTPDVTIDGNAVTVDTDDLLIHNENIFYGQSIMRHFFDQEHLKYEEGKLTISTEGSKAYVIPWLENGVSLLSMETTSVDNYIGTQATTDNNNVLHNEAVYSRYDGKRYIEYRLDKNYHWFKCNAFVTKNATNISYDSNLWAWASVTITADNGIVLWGTESISRDAALQESPVIDVSGMKYIRITFSNAGREYGNGAILAIGEPRLFTE